MKKNKGFLTYEVLTVAILYVVIFLIIYIVAFKSVNKTKFKSMKYDAVAFSYNVDTYLINNSLDYSKRVYLKDIIAYDKAYNITSPFNADNKCSSIESYVTNINNKVLITLKCDNYILKDYMVGDDNYKIYKVGKWQDNKPILNKDNIEEVTLYNYKKHGAYMLNQFVPLDMMINMYNENENSNAKSLNDINDYEKRVFYRIEKSISL